MTKGLKNLIFLERRQDFTTEATEKTKGRQDNRIIRMNRICKTMILRGVYPELDEGLRMTNRMCLVILRTEGTKNLGFEFL
jgi:hypothetical protein